MNHDSLDRIIAGDIRNYTLTVQDTLCDENADFVKNYEQQQSNQIIRQVILDLSDIEQKVINQYFGFQDDQCMTQQEIAESLGLSQSYISKILVNSLKKINKNLQQLGIIEVHDRNKQKNPIQKVKK